MADLSVDLCGLSLPNPFVVASGPLTYGAEAILEALCRWRGGGRHQDDPPHGDRQPRAPHRRPRARQPAQHRGLVRLFGGGVD